VKHFALFLAVTLAFALTQSVAPARAGELDLTGDFSTFSSPDNANGPWRAVTGVYRWVAGPDTPSVTLETRADADFLAPTHSNAVTIDDYHTWSPRFFTYGAVGVSAGSVLPTRTFYFEGDQKLGRSLTTVFGAGIGVVVDPVGVIQRYINVGPTFYAPAFNVSLRYLQTFTSGRTGTGTGIMTIEAGYTGKTISTLTLLAGDQPPNGVVTTATTAGIGQRAVLAGIEFKHWTSPKGGILAGVGVGRLNDYVTGTGLYAQRDFTLGIFRDLGPPLP
jgi:YaiO family outer membrane protein